MHTSQTVLALLFGAISAAPAADQVTELPQMQKFDSWKLYSGYLDINEDMSLHYMFAES